MRPLIGISSNVIARPDPLPPVYGVSQAYSSAIERAGGIPVLIPPQTDPDAVRTLCERLDGILFTGGGDLDPATYGETRIEECGPAEPGRDALELALARLALNQGMPVFGICRGMQLLNVARGGTLYQDLKAQRPEDPPHPILDYQGPRNALGHAIEVKPGSPLARIMAVTSLRVNSFHHQAVKAAGENVEILAWAEDGIPEGMIVSGHPYAVAVQFHPEDLAIADAASQNLFDAFVQACAAHAANRASATISHVASATA